MADPIEPDAPLEPPASSSPPTPQQARLIWSALTALALAALLAVAGLAFMGFVTFLSWSYPVLLPIGLAVIVALLLEPAVALIQSRGMNRASATLSVSLLAVIAFILFWAFLLPPLVNETGSFFYKLPGWINDGVDKLQTLENAPEISKPPVLHPAPAVTNQGAPVAAPATTNEPVTKTAPEKTTERPPVNHHDLIQAWLKANIPVVEQAIQNNVAHIVYTAVGPVGQALGFLLGFGFVPIYVYYFLADQDHIAKHWHDYVPLRPSPFRNEVVSVLTEINEVLVKYFRGQIIVAACNGLLTFIGLSLIGIPYSLVLGVIAGALSIVPFLGIVVSILPALLLGFISTGGWLKPVGVLIVFALVQMSESMFITPRVQSHSTGLHPLTIIIGILFWSMLLPGLLGPVVAVPLTCSVVVLLRRYVWQIGPGKTV
jgi:predicted PurR-regulated permease PerM